MMMILQATVIFHVLFLLKFTLAFTTGVAVDWNDSTIITSSSTTISYCPFLLRRGGNKQTRRRKTLPWASSPLFSSPNQEDDDESIDEINFSSFQSELSKRNEQAQQEAAEEENQEFDGYMFRNVLLEKWGACWDVEFQKFDTLGQRRLYLNVLPFQLGRKPFRHATEYDYLCHLQAVVEILIKYNQLDQILYQIQETKKKPRPGTSPLVAVPLRLELSPEQLDYGQYCNLLMCALSP